MYLQNLGPNPSIQDDNPVLTQQGLPVQPSVEHRNLRPRLLDLKPGYTVVLYKLTM